MDLNCNKDADTVQVTLRIRPLVEAEISRGCTDCVKVFPELEQVQVRDLRFTYNHVFPAHVGQREFYEVSVKSLINKLLQGYNVTIFAYGQTGSGKTYSMGTSNYESSGSNQGILPQAVGDIFDYVEAHEKEFIFKISVSFMELYQEKCYDLLAGRSRPKSIVEIREDHTGVKLPDLTVIKVNTASETMMHLTKGSEGRAVGATAMNACSSRSHAVFTIYIYKESKQDKNNATTSKFHLVDLAGSERLNKTKATGDRLKEAIKINHGLLALGIVISALGAGKNRRFINFRDSKLTRLLQDSLGGNSVTLMIACISPADYNLEETVSTLRYADRARRIKNKPIVNKDAKAAEISRLNKLVNDLRLQLMGKTPLGDTEAFSQLQEKYDDLLRESQIIIDKHKKEHSNMCEKALLAEAAKEKMKRKFLEITEKCSQTLETINESNDERTDEGYKGSLIDGVRDLISKLEEMRTEQLTCDSEIIQHELRDTGNTIHNDGEEDEDNIYQQEAHAFETNKDPVDENRRKRVADLEEEIACLKKKCQQQASIIKVKEQNEAKIRALTNELHSMESKKRAESEQARRWKQEIERNMTRLKAEDSKRRFAMQRMEAMHVKQRDVLKRKMEQAVAVTKRLKLQEELETVKKENDQLRKKDTENKLEINLIEKNFEEKVSALQGVNERQAETQIVLLRELQHKNELLMAELEEFKQKHGEVRAKMPPPANQKPKNPKQRVLDYIEPENDNDESGDDLDSDKDPEFRLTPMQRKQQKSESNENCVQYNYKYLRSSAKRASRLTMNFTLEPNRSKSNDDRTSIINNSSTSTAVKIASAGTSRCFCRASCSTRHCGCVKAGSKCGGTCGCKRTDCMNRIHPTQNRGPFRTYARVHTKCNFCVHNLRVKNN